MATATETKPKSENAASRSAAKTQLKDAKAARDARVRALQVAANSFKMLSDATRIEILITLSEGPRNVNELSGMAQMSQPAVSHHLALLRHSGLILPRRVGKNNYYNLSDTGATLAGIAKSLVG